MAKKTVASLQKGEGRTYSKVIKMVKSPKTGAYISKKRWFPTTPSRKPSNNSSLPRIEHRSGASPQMDRSASAFFLFCGWLPNINRR